MDDADDELARAHAAADRRIVDDGDVEAVADA